ncbi:hypothetical protein AB0E01_22755 [Nocardia vinacea]|uniref:hypothetical protein n=1 Tax=Nocardia vinacea TaxID=96468 RepID=UPI0033FDBF22
MPAVAYAPTFGVRTNTPTFELVAPANRWTAIVIGPERTFVKVAGRDMEHCDDLATAAVILRRKLEERLAGHPRELLRTWSGSPEIWADDSLCIVLRNRGRTIFHKFNLSLREIRDFQADW